VRVVVALLIAIAIAALAAAPAGAQKLTETQAPAAAAPPRLDAKAWILIDPRDDSVLASKSPDKRLPIASTTKLMTAYLALKHLKPSQMIAAQNYHPEASAEIELGLRAGERMRVRDLLYGLLLWRAIRIAYLSKDPFGTYVAAGISSMFAIQMFVNVGMVIGIMPITGIPLPFLSYGGSSILLSFAAIGMLESIHMRRFT